MLEKHVITNAGLKPQKRAYAWNVTAVGTAIASNVLIIPLLARFLNSKELALWFVFLALGGLVQLLDFGFEPTISRNISLVLSGATKVARSGLADEVSLSHSVDIDLLAGIVNAARRIYKMIAIAVCCLMMIPMTLYINVLIGPSLPRHLLLSAWLVYASSSAFSFYYGYANALLIGAGFQQIAYKIQSVSRLVTVSLACLTVFLGMGLFGLSMSYFAGSVLLRVLLVTTSKRKMPFLFLNRNEDAPLSSDILRALWYNAKRLGVVQVGAFLIQRSSMLVAASVLGLSSSASYSLTLSVMLAISSLAQSFANVNIPYFSQLRQQKRYGELKVVYIRTLVSSVIICGTAYVLIVVFGNKALYYMDAKTLLLPPLELSILAVIFVLELHHGLAAAFISTGNTVPFVKAAILSGLAIVSLSLVLTPSYGVIGLIASQGVVQILYNNWKWPVEALNELRCKEVAGRLN
jgi:O-antigen/teichoic acid export membrane protein